MNERIRLLIRQSKEQGYLTYSDINEALPEGVNRQDDIDNILSILQNLEIEILDPSEVDSFKAKQEEQEEAQTKTSGHDILDDPVRMYLKQMGQVPLLTREQEVEISKRIEAAELEVKRILYGLGFTAKEHIALADKLTADPPKERFDRVTLDKVIETREKHLKTLHRLIKKVREEDGEVDKKYLAWRKASKSRAEKAFGDFNKLNDKLQKNFSKFLFKALSNFF